MTAPQPAIPYAGSTVIGLEARDFAAIQRCVRLLFGLAHSEVYAQRADREEAEEAGDAVVRHVPGNTGVFMGYDFHVTAAGPRLIEINTNAGGALLNGLHTASLCDPVKLACLCAQLLSVETLEREVADTFRAEYRAMRGEQATLARIAIVDDQPAQQFLRPEFELFRELFAREGIEARVADTRALELAPGGGLALGGWPVELVYLRDTDFRLASERTRTLRNAYLRNEVVVTPPPREHFLLADKRRLAWFSSAAELAALGMEGEDARFLSEIVPEAWRLCDLDPERVWRERAEWVFKPAAAFGSRAVYRGDKLTRKKFLEIAAQGDYVAQRHTPPGRVHVETSEGPRGMKFDVRAYAYRDRVILLGARVYKGQVTNLRSPGGGFSAICVVRDGACG